VKLYQLQDEIERVQQQIKNLQLQILQQKKNGTPQSKTSPNSSNSILSKPKIFADSYATKESNGFMLSPKNSSVISLDDSFVRSSPSPSTKNSSQENNGASPTRRSPSQLNRVEFSTTPTISHSNGANNSPPYLHRNGHSHSKAKTPSSFKLSDSDASDMEQEVQPITNLNRI
jgi:hypothetical protein